MISNARMYSVTPAAAAAWNRIFNWVQAQAGLAFTPEAHPPPLLLSDLWSREDLGMVMMCGLPLSRRARSVQILGAPVPCLPRYEDAPVYRTYLAVRADAPAMSLEDTFGGVAGYTLTDSHSGYFAFRHHLLRHYGSDGQYAAVVGNLLNANNVILALADRRIDVGPLDGYVYDLICATAREFAAKVRVVATTAPAPIPPIVCSGNLDAASVARLREALLQASDANALAEARQTLLLNRFEPVDAARYGLQNEIASMVERSPVRW